ncbi:ESPR-type extended signal peptide-containing protein, partial [Glaesserella parasuis]|nr:ESPR-type extended signal peptide-containing protein [Glaesserella parasuis]
MNKIFRVIWSHAQQAWVVVSELVKSHTKTSTYTDKRAQVCTSDYFLDKQQDKFKLSLLSLVLLGIFFSSEGLAAEYFVAGASASVNGSDDGTIGIGKESKASYGAVAIGQQAKAEGRHNIAIGYDSNTGTHNNSITIGNNTLGSGENVVAIGTRSKAGGRSVVLGGSAEGNTTQTVVIGNLAKATGSQSIAIGADAKAEGYGSISIGGDDLDQTDYHASNNTKQTRQTTTAKGKASVAIGGLSLATGDGSIVLGPVASANHVEGIAIGA